MDNLFLLFFFPLGTCVNQLAAQIAYSFFLQIFAAILKNLTYSIEFKKENDQGRNICFFSFYKIIL